MHGVSMECVLHVASGASALHPAMKTVLKHHSKCGPEHVHEAVNHLRHHTSQTIRLPTPHILHNTSVKHLYFKEAFSILLCLVVGSGFVWLHTMACYGNV